MQLKPIKGALNKIMYMANICHFHGSLAVASLRRRQVLWFLTPFPFLLLWIRIDCLLFWSVNIWCELVRKHLLTMWCQAGNAIVCFMDWKKEFRIASVDCDANWFVNKIYYIYNIKIVNWYICFLRKTRYTYISRLLIYKCIYFASNSN